MTEKFEIKNRWTGKVQFTAEIECAPDAPLSWKLRLAVLWGIKNGSDLRWSDLSGSDLRDCDLRGSDLRWSDLSGSDLRDCDLRGSDLRWSDLRGSDRRGAKIDFEIATPDQAAPRIAEVAKAAIADESALAMDTWHTCETTHCIAGWAIHLAGEQGKALEEKFGPHIAGLSLLGTEAASHFYDSKADATAWLRGKLEAEV